MNTSSDRASPGAGPSLRRRLVQFTLGTLAVVLAFVVIFQSAAALVEYRHGIERSRERAESAGHTAATALAEELDRVAAIAVELATRLSDEEVGDGGCGDCAACARCRADEALQSAYFNNADFANIGLAFAEYAADPELRLYAPFIAHEGVSRGLIQRVDRHYDYRAGIESIAPEYSGEHGDNLREQQVTSSEKWYSASLARPCYWMPPSYDKSVDGFVIRYTVPLPYDGATCAIAEAEAEVLDEENGSNGVAFVDVDLEWIRRKLQQQDIGDNNYLVLLNDSDQVLYHSLRGQDEIITDLRMLDRSCLRGRLLKLSERRSKDCKLLELEARANQAVTGNELTGQNAWFHSHEVGETGWRLMTVIMQEHGYPKSDQAEKLDQDEWWQLFDRNWVALVTFLVCSLLAGFSFYRLKKVNRWHKRLWRDSLVYTLIFLAGIVAIWILEYNRLSETNPKSTVLANEAMVNEFIRQYSLESLKAHRSPPTFVPVGLFIQSIEFISATNVTLTGYVWHRYLADQEMDLENGTIFPEAISTHITPAYRSETGDEVVRGWYFETTLRERFDPGKFPFDRQEVWVRLWHEKVGEHVILLPDFKSYDSLSTRALPGVEKDFVLSGWRLSRSFFDIRENSYNTNLGTPGFATRSSQPELYFNIEVIRNFTNPFISHFFPLFVVLLMLFAVLITISMDEKRKEIFGFNVAAVAASCSALFFVVLIAHVQLRGELAANSIVYMEYFYLISYLLILLVTANAVLFTWRVPINLIRFEDNLFPKLIYWPVVTGAFFFATVFAFIGS